MSRSKKSRSLKRNHSGLKTGTKERTKLESKQRKANKKLANPRAVTRQRSVYQQHLDNNGLIEAQHVDGKAAVTQPIALTPKTLITDSPVTKVKKPKQSPIETNEAQESNLWDQLETPQNNDTF